MTKPAAVPRQSSGLSLLDSAGVEGRRHGERVTPSTMRVPPIFMPSAGTPFAFEVFGNLRDRHGLFCERNRFADMIGMPMSDRNDIRIASRQHFRLR